MSLLRNMCEEKQNSHKHLEEVKQVSDYHSFPLVHRKDVLVQKMKVCCPEASSSTHFGNDTAC